MGYCYEGRKLCCDICGRAGARKVRCPFGYCPSTAACAECRKTHGAKGTGKLARAAHVAMGCDVAHARFEAHCAEENKRLLAGESLRRSARSCKVDGYDVVHVLFSDVEKRWSGFYMAPETYGAIPLGKLAAPHDYCAHGLLVPAPEDFTP